MNEHHAGVWRQRYVAKAIGAAYRMQKGSWAALADLLDATRALEELKKLDDARARKPKRKSPAHLMVVSDVAAE
jgi:hypothetical protein